MASIPDKQNNSNSSDTDNYSVDDMMARLKKGDRQKRQSDRDPEGELITREDGTQVVKVRRRKRRSKQSSRRSSGSKTNPKLKWAILAGTVGLTVLLTAGIIFIIAKYNGRHFKATTESTISELSGATQTKLTQLRVSPVSANAQKAEITWDNQAFIKNASFRTIHANIKANSFFSRRWIGEDIVATSGKIILQEPSASAESIISEIVSPYVFNAYRCNKLQLLFGSERGASSIQNLKASLRPLVDGQHKIIFHDGILKVKTWPDMTIESGIINLKPNSADIDAILKSSKSHNGEILIAGNILKNSSSPIALDIKAKNYPIQELLGKDLGWLIQGQLQSESGTFSYSFDKLPSEALSFILPFNSNELKCKGLPLFRELHQLIGEAAYVTPVFYSCRGTLMRTSKGITINDLELINNNLLNIKGNLSVSAKGKLSGNLSVGIPVSAFHRKAPAPFSEPKGGFHYLDITLNGTAKSPNDSLHQQLKGHRAKTSRPIGRIIQPKKETTQPTQPPSNLKEKDFDDLYKN